MTDLPAILAGGNLLLFALAAAWLLLLTAAAFLIRFAASRRRVRGRIAHARGLPPRRSKAPASAAQILLTGLGRRIARSGLLPSRTLAELRATLTAAGFRTAEGLWLFIGIKIALFVGLPLLGFLLLAGRPSTPMRIAIPAALAGVGLLAPDMVVRRLRAAHLAKVEKDLPDALDLLVICAQAGLGLEAAIARVGEEMQATHREIARELELTSRELQMTSDSRIALVALGIRTGLESLKRFGSTLSQSLQYGTPLAGALRMLSAELRQEGLTRLEERATRLPVLLTLPMVVFILPCVFIVVGAPAVIRIMHALAH